MNLLAFLYEYTVLLNAWMRLTPNPNCIYGWPVSPYLFCLYQTPSPNAFLKSSATYYELVYRLHLAVLDLYDDFKTAPATGTALSHSVKHRLNPLR